MTASGAAPWPTEVRLSKDRRTLAIAFDPARLHLFDAATGLRVDQSA